MQQNETVDILKDDLSQMETTVSASVQEPEEGLKEVFTFTDLSYSKNKLISFIRWIPEYADTAFGLHITAIRYPPTLSKNAIY